MTEAYKNYIKLDTKNPLQRTYMIIDTLEYLADDLFVKSKIPVKFGKEFQKPDDVYRLVQCRIHRKYEKRFLSCLERLKEKMLLLGHTDYEEYCKSLNFVLAESKKWEGESERNI